jgi:archaetidylinositol phosphate synthase
MLTKMKKKVQEALVTEAKIAHDIGLTPNKVSVIGLALAFVSAFAYAAWESHRLYILFATVLLLLSGLCDALDGVIARLYRQATPFGGFLDSLLDRYADAVVFVGIIIGRLCDSLWGLIALTGSLLVSYTRARAEAAGTKLESIGLAERAERIIILATASLIATFWHTRTEAVMNTGIILLAILSNLTVLERSLHVYKRLKKL